MSEPAAATIRGKRPMTQAISYSIAALFALLVHGVAIALMLVNWNLDVVELTDNTRYYIEATIVADNPYKAKKRNSTRQEEQRRKEKPQHRRPDEAELLRQQQAEREKQQPAAQLPKEQALSRELPPEPEAVASTPAGADKADEQRAGFEEQLALLVAAEQGLRKAITDDEKTRVYAAQIRQDIAQNWSRPPSARNGMRSVLRVFLVPTGEMVDVTVDESSGNDAFDRSAMLAVRKTGRFVVPSDTLTFERNFREFILVFKPEDLRL